MGSEMCIRDSRFGIFFEEIDNLFLIFFSHELFSLFVWTRGDWFYFDNFFLTELFDNFIDLLEVEFFLFFAFDPGVGEAGVVGDYVEV